MSHELWRPIAGAVGYEVSNLGRVRSWRRKGSRADSALAAEPKLMKTSPNAWGYPVVNIARNGEKQKPVAVHILVLTAFCGPPKEGMESLHEDGNRLNATLTNLSWGTRTENKADSIRHGTAIRPSIRGEKHMIARLTEAQVLAIKDGFATGVTDDDLAKTFGVAHQTINSIRNGLSWAWLDHEDDAARHANAARYGSHRPRGENNPKARLTERMVLEIKDRLVNGEGSTEIARSMGVGKSTIDNIKFGASWSWLVGKWWDPDDSGPKS